MTTDRKAATEAAKDHAQFGAGELQNLAAAFLEVTAELEQKRKAREEAGKSANRWFHDCMLIACKIESAEQRAADLQARLNLVSAQHARLADQVYEDDGETLKIVSMQRRLEDVGAELEAMRALAAARLTESAATMQEQPVQSPVDSLTASTQQDTSQEAAVRDVPASFAANPYLHDQESALREVEAEKMIPEDKQ